MATTRRVTTPTHGDVVAEIMVTVQGPTRRCVAALGRLCVSVSLCCFGAQTTFPPSLPLPPSPSTPGLRPPETPVIEFVIISMGHQRVFKHPPPSAVDGFRVSAYTV
jgi:hypothetical protein